MDLTSADGRTTFLSISNLTDVNGGIFKAGTSSSKVTTSLVGMKFLSFYLENTAASGDNRGMYLRLYHSTAGGGGEALRAFTTCNNVAAGTAHGAHISLDFAATGSITGLGVAMRATLHVPNQAQTAGTYSACLSEIWFDGSSSSLAGTTKAVIHDFSLGGDNTNHNTIKGVLAFTNIHTDQFASSTDETKYAKSLKILVNGTPYYLMLASDAS
jgi:hypothetical protein